MITWGTTQNRTLRLIKKVTSDLNFSRKRSTSLVLENFVSILAQNFSHVTQARRVSRVRFRSHFPRANECLVA
jgi:hypothetical protein